MIIPSTMTDDEIRSYILNDYRELFSLIKKDKNDFRRKVLKEAKNFPYRRVYKHTSRRNIDYKIVFIADKRGCHDNPKYTPVAIYNAYEGKYMAMIGVGIVQLFPPHFFKRYRERIIKNNDISTEELMEHFLSYCDDGVTWSYIDEERKPMYRCIAEIEMEDEWNMVGVSDNYCVFGVQKKDLIVCKTIISNDLIKEDQKKHFEFLREENKLSMECYYKR